MYQTVGHQAIDLYAEAMDLPLYRRTIQGSSLDTGRNYSQKEGDEVEDLYELLKLVKVSLSFPTIREQLQFYNPRFICGIVPVNRDPDLHTYSILLIHCFAGQLIITDEL